MSASRTEQNAWMRGYIAGEMRASEQLALEPRINESAQIDRDPRVLMLIERAVRVARDDERTRIGETVAYVLERHLGLHRGLRELAGQTRAVRVATELRDMAASAGRVAEELGRPAGYRYQGGPVDWETGLPAGSPCAAARRIGAQRGI